MYGRPRPLTADERAHPYRPFFLRIAAAGAFLGIVELAVMAGSAPKPIISTAVNPPLDLCSNPK